MLPLYGAGRFPRTDSPERVRFATEPTAASETTQTSAAGDASEVERRDTQRGDNPTLVLGPPNEQSGRCGRMPIAFDPSPITDLGEGAERAAQKAVGHFLVLRPYLQFDPNLPMAVVVHGHYGSPASMQKLIDRLHSEGKQVIIVCFEDHKKRIEDLGDLLALGLVQMREALGARPDATLDLVGYSMGGLVARAALNSLANPTWFRKTARYDETPHPQAGFARVRLRTIDTPWAGAFHGPGAVRVLAKAMLVPEFGLRAGIEMYGGTARLFKKLSTVPLSGVSMIDFPGTTPTRDKVPNLPELSRAEIAQILVAVRTDVAPKRARAANYWNLIKAFDWYPKLKQEVMTAENNDEFVATWRDVAEPIPGAHTEIPDSPELIERLVHSLK